MIVGAQQNVNVETITIIRHTVLRYRITHNVYGLHSWSRVMLLADLSACIVATDERHNVDIRLYRVASCRYPHGGTVSAPQIDGHARPSDHHANCTSNLESCR